MIRLGLSMQPSILPERTMGVKRTTYRKKYSTTGNTIAGIQLYQKHTTKKPQRNCKFIRKLSENYCKISVNLSEKYCKISVKFLANCHGGCIRIIQQIYNPRDSSRTTTEKQTENPRATTRQQRGGQVFGLGGSKHGLAIVQPLQVLDLGKTTIESFDLRE